MTRHQTMTDNFIREQKAKLLPKMTFDTEMVMRHAFMQGLTAMEDLAYGEGVVDQRQTVLKALGAKEQFYAPAH
jgi:hypothetical protein